MRLSRASHNLDTVEKGEVDMIFNILVATDGSQTAGRAVELAADLAAKLGVPITVGHVLQHGARVDELSRMAEIEHLVRHVKVELQPHLNDIPTNMDALFSGSLSGADRERTVILAEAYRDAEIVRGDGDAKATAIYATAFNRNPEFYAFYRSLEAYKTSLGSERHVLVLGPDSDFLRYLDSAKGGK